MRGTEGGLQRPVQGLPGLVLPVQELIAEGQLVIIHALLPGMLQKVPQSQLRLAVVYLRHRQIVGNGLYIFLSAQAPGHTAGQGIVHSCLHQLIQVAVAAAKVGAALHLNRQTALPIGLLLCVLKAIHRVAIISIPQKTLARPQEIIALIRLGEQLLKRPQEAQAQIALPFVQGRQKLLQLLRKYRIQQTRYPDFP